MEYQLLYRTMYNVLRHLKRYERLKTYNPAHKGGSYETIDNYKVEIVDDGNYEMIFIWSPIRPCIVVDLDKRNNYAALNTVEYDKGCTVDGKMKRGSGTKEMVKFTIDLLKKRGVKKVHLKDKSTIECNGKEVSLKLMYFLKNGETWYEKNFGFKPTSDDLDEYNLVKKNRKDLLDIDKLRNAPCELFTTENLKILTKKIGFSFHDSIVWEKIL
jgi:hypothetical protein